MSIQYLFFINTVFSTTCR